VRITDLSKGSVIDTLTISRWTVAAVYRAADSGKHDLRSQMQMVRADGTGQTTMIGDGKTLDITPCFTPTEADRL